MLDLPDGSGWGDHIQLLQIYEKWDQANYDPQWCIENDLQVFFSCFYLLQDEYKYEYTKRGATDLEIGPFRPHSVIISSTIQGLSLCLFRCSAFYAMYRGPLLPNFPPYMNIEAQSVASTILGGSNWVIFL